MYEELKTHAESLKKKGIPGLLTSRKNSWFLQSGSIYLDASRNYLSDETPSLINKLLSQSGFTEVRNKLFSGGILNQTENRSSDHVALRDFSGLYKGNPDISNSIKLSLDKMKNLVEQIHSGRESSHLIGNIRHVVSIGIGGSDLGPRMIVDALEEFRHPAAPEILFLATVDDYELKRILARIKLENTLFISVSKSLTTAETLKMANFFIDRLKSQNLDFRRHFIQATANKKAAEITGLPEENCIYFPESIGGRYSLWSSTGFSIPLLIGFEGFMELLKGAADMDRHFLEAPFSENIPVMMGFLEFWYTNFFGSSFLTVNAYTERLRLFPMYLQQLQMESNGKSVDTHGKPVTYLTAEAIFGVTGTPAQHSYFQALHQGTSFFHADFIGLTSAGKKGYEKDHNDFLFSNMLAQAKTLTDGLHDSPEHPVPSFKAIAGNKPCNIFLLKGWNPGILGSLTAAYEHKTFTQGVILGINSFDQWGVERGKKISSTITSHLLDPGHPEMLDKATHDTIEYFRKLS